MFLQSSCCGFARRGMRAAAVCVLKALWHGSSHAPMRWFSLRPSGSGPIKINSKKSVCGKTPGVDRVQTSPRNVLCTAFPCLLRSVVVGWGDLGLVGETPESGDISA